MDRLSILNKFRGFRYVYSFITKDTIIQLKRYILTGFTTFGLEYIVYITLLSIYGTWYIPSNTSMLVGFIFSFVVNKLWSFESRSNTLRQFALYAILFLMNISIHNALMYLMTDIFRINPLFSKVLAMGMIGMWNFVAFKKVVYR